MRRYWYKLLRWVNGESLYGMDRTENFDRPEKKKKAHHNYKESTTKERVDNWITHHEKELMKHLRPLLSVWMGIMIIACLLLTVSDLPSFGDPSNPVNNAVSERYIEKGLEETGGLNIVGGMILDYRAFDTLGESHVLFIAVCAVIILLRNDRKKQGKDADESICNPTPDPILQKIAKILIPMILMFGIYIVLNGHLSPGGGFSGGTVMGAALILYYNAFGSEKVQKFFTYKTFNRISVTALGFYAFAKSYAFYTGANGIHSIIPLGTPGAIISSGLILPLNIAVGVIVCCTMFGFYSLFTKEAI